MGWNHRILAHDEEGEIYFQIHEVYYNAGTPISHTEKAVSVGGDEIKNITWTLYRMLKCRKKPILWAGDKFPQEYKLKSK